MISGLCYICGAPALNTCSICGRPVCNAHYDAEKKMCSSCASGFRV